MVKVPGQPHPWYGKRGADRSPAVIRGDTAMARGMWGPVFVLAVVAGAAADEPHAIWSSSSVSGFDWTPGRRYSSREACEQAATAQRQRAARNLDIMRRIGADTVVQSLVGDRVYECRPSPSATPATPPRGGAGEAP